MSLRDYAAFANSEEAIALRRRVLQINSRARRLGSPGQLAVTDITERLAGARGRCSACGKNFGHRFRDRWVVSFVNPLSQGGECCRENISIICRQCEMGRSAKMGAW